MTAIEWTDRVWNPTTGCDRVSPGCDHCYAMTMAKRLKGMGSAKYQTDGDSKTSGPGFGIAMHPESLGEPLKWRKPQRIFVNSMSDLFHAGVDDIFLGLVWQVMAECPQHTFQILTKRPARMRSFLRKFEPLPNVHLVVSAEDQQRSDQRIPILLDTPAAVRGVSLEPLLGPINLAQSLAKWTPNTDHSAWQGLIMPTREVLHWVIVGGESGRGARPMHPGWARQIRDDCKGAGIAFLFKQWGEWVPERMLLHANNAPAAFLSVDGTTRLLVNGKPTAHPMSRGQDITVRRVGKKRGGRELDGRTWDQYPETVTA